MDYSVFDVVLCTIFTNNVQSFNSLNTAETQQDRKSFFALTSRIFSGSTQHKKWSRWFFKLGYQKMEVTPSSFKRLNSTHNNINHGYKHLDIASKFNENKQSHMSYNKMKTWKSVISLYFPLTWCYVVHKQSQNL